MTDIRVPCLPFVFDELIELLSVLGGISDYFFILKD